MIETLVLAGSVGLVISGVMLAVSRNKWRKHALKLQDVISDYEDELQDEKRLKRAFEEERNEMARKNAALIGDREVFRKQIAISQDTVAMLKTEIDELRGDEKLQRERQAEFDATRKQVTDLQVGLRLTKEQRDKAESARIALSEQRDKLRTENANLADELERIKNSNAFLVRECEKMGSQLTAIKEALATMPEPGE